MNFSEIKKIVKNDYPSKQENDDKTCFYDCDDSGFNEAQITLDKTRDETETHIPFFFSISENFFRKPLSFIQTHFFDSQPNNLKKSDTEVYTFVR